MVDGYPRTTMLSALIENRGVLNFILFILGIPAMKESSKMTFNQYD